MHELAKKKGSAHPQAEEQKLFSQRFYYQEYYSIRSVNSFEMTPLSCNGTEKRPQLQSLLLKGHCTALHFCKKSDHGQDYPRIAFYVPPTCHYSCEPLQNLVLEYIVLTPYTSYGHCQVRSPKNTTQEDGPLKHSSDRVRYASASQIYCSFSLRSRA